nr:hypothetical protein CFP56_20025 [Quercus suber]
MGDGLGGAKEQTPEKKKGVEEEIQPAALQGGPAPSNVDNSSATQMETADIVEDLTQNLCPSLSPMIQVINSAPNPSPSANRPQDIENQIAEIDTALKMFDSHAISTTDKSTVKGENNSEIDVDILGSEKQSNPPHVTIQVTPHDTSTLRTWKRLARSNVLPENSTQHSVLNKRNREFEEEAHPELPKKKVLVSKEENTEISMAEVWGTMASFSFRQTRTFSSIQEVLLYADKEQKNPELLASVMWTLWHRRNKVRTSSADFPLAQVAPSAIQTLELFRQANSVDATHYRDFPQPRVRWSPPAEGEIKVNFDGAQFKDLGKAGENLFQPLANSLSSLGSQARKILSSAPSAGKQVGFHSLSPKPGVPHRLGAETMKPSLLACTRGRGQNLAGLAPQRGQ